MYIHMAMHKIMDGTDMARTRCLCFDVCLFLCGGNGIECGTLVMLNFPAWIKAEGPNSWILTEVKWPVKLLNEMFKNLRSESEGKSEGNLPFIWFIETSK